MPPIPGLGKALYGAATSTWGTRAIVGGALAAGMYKVAARPAMDAAMEVAFNDKDADIKFTGGKLSPLIFGGGAIGGAANAAKLAAPQYYKDYSPVANPGIGNAMGIGAGATAGAGLGAIAGKLTGMGAGKGATLGALAGGSVGSVASGGLGGIGLSGIVAGGLGYAMRRSKRCFDRIYSRRRTSYSWIRFYRNPQR